MEVDIDVVTSVIIGLWQAVFLASFTPAPEKGKKPFHVVGYFNVGIKTLHSKRN
jgi:hypothetical protein